MIWKILFTIQVLVFGFISFGGITSTLAASEFTITAGYVLSAVMVLISGLFFALGWKKRLYGRVFSNVLLAFILVFMLFSITTAVITGLNTATADVRINLGEVDHVFYLSTVAKLIVLSLLLYVILYSPVLIGIMRYKKVFNYFDDIKNPYRKILFTYIAAESVLVILYVLLSLNYGETVLWDYLYLFFMVVKVLLAAGYAYNIRFGGQIIWKILAIPYAVVVLTGCFFCSEAFLEVSGGNLIIESYSGAFFEFIINAVVLWALYRYAFKDDVYKSEQIESIES